VWLAGLLNVMGIRPVGSASVLLTATLAAPFIALVGAGFPRLFPWRIPAPTPVGHDFLATLGGALTVVIWNFGGWENLSVASAEINEVQRNYLRAVAIVIPAVAVSYILPLAVCLAGAGGTMNWHTGSFAEKSALIGGPLIGSAIALGGAVSSFAVFEAAVLWVSRLPFVLARERYLPPALARLWSRTDTPARSILCSCGVFTLLIPLGFTTLVMLDVFFYMLALTFEMAALIRLRQLYPRREGLFVIGGGRAALYLVALAPILTWIATFGLAVSRSAHDLIIAVALGACAGPVYAALRQRYGGPANCGPRPITGPSPSRLT